MEETTVLIVGAGPSGLALAVGLGQINIKTVILEKELEVSEDPRGITVIGDAVRISFSLGIGNELTTNIGRPTGRIHFHHKTWNNPAFLYFDTDRDNLQQSVPNAINQFQPNFERELRKRIESLPSVDLRVGCEVVDRTEEESGVIIKYKDKEGNNLSIRASYLVGADGKRGVVRKKFLEPEGIKQEIGLYNHVSTWVAANFDITPPTRETHPDFPLWKVGYSPEQVYDAFWPSGFHFVNDPKRPVATGRFGPKGTRFWRHEYAIHEEDNLDDPIAHLWSQIGSWLDIPGDKFSSKLKGTTVTFPRDCVRILRCRPFTFTTRVVNRWHCRRTILIGDASHVYPPFGGQGIASGVRDASSLYWRLALLSRITLPPDVHDKFLTSWGQEQRQACDHATKRTRTNGVITNMRSPILAFLFRSLMRFLWSIPGLPLFVTRQSMGDSFRFQQFDGLFALREKGGGHRMPQIWIRRGDEKPQLSDQVFHRDASRLALINIVEDENEIDEIAMAKAIGKLALPGDLLREENVTYLNLRSGKNTKSSQIYRPCGREELVALGITPINGYDPHTLARRIGSGAKYVIVRPDFYIHSVASSVEDLFVNGKAIVDYFT